MKTIRFKITKVINGTTWERFMELDEVALAEIIAENLKANSFIGLDEDVEIVYTIR